MNNTASTPRSRAYRKVSKACQRCRRQKLKCDNQRPCVPCTRTGVDCLPPSPEQWKIYGTRMGSIFEPPPKKVRIGGPSSENNQSRGNSDISRHGDDSDDLVLENRSALVNDQIAGSSDPPWRSSSTMSLVDRAFMLHNANSPGLPVTTAISEGQRGSINLGERPSNERPETNFENAPTLNPRNEKLGTIRGVTHSSRLAVSDLIELLPNFEVATLLVDTYFDRVHWFMLIFHQDEFRKRWQKLYEISNNRTPLKNSDIGFISVFLMVIAIAIQYTGTHRKRLLARHGFDYEKHGELIFAAIRSKLLDIVSLESLEAVQTCVLLGTYYLFHGSPGLAWPVCGCGLRIAQALNLHRKVSHSALDSALSVEWRNKNETRKRCWWAIYEIETFCSMSYGYPHSIKDIDCDVEPLDPSAKLQFVQSPTSFDEPLLCDATLLSYKYFMSKLSVLIKAILAELYGIGSVSNVENTTSSVSSTEDLHFLINQVVKFDTKLRRWHAEIPSKLEFRDPSVQTSYFSLEDMDTDIGASGAHFETHIFQLQALALKLAYENTRILVHRPLLSYKLVSKQRSTQPTAPSWDAPNYADNFRLSLQSCREAALNTSEIASMPITELISGTYAATFVSIHTFTAGVTLGILSSVEPLSQESHEAKSGLHRLMNIQTRLKDRSPSAVQGLEILQRLTRHIMEKELNVMLDVSRPLKPQISMVGTSSTGPSTSIPRQTTVTATESQQFVQFSSGAPQQPILEHGSQNVSNFPCGTESTRNISSFQNGTDHTPLQAVSASDQATSTSTSHLESQIEQTFMGYSLDWLPTDDFSTCEQAWIWCLDSRAFAE